MSPTGTPPAEKQRRRRGSLECNPEIPAFPGEENYIAYQGQLGASQVVLVVKNPPANAGDVRLGFGFDFWMGRIP